MAIFHIINSLESVGGAEKIVCELHSGLIAKGIESRLLTIVGDAGGVPYARSLNCKHVRDPRVIIYLARYLRREYKPGDIVHSHLFPANLYLSIVSRLLKCQMTLVTTEHSTSNRRRGFPGGRALDSYLYAPYASILCISEGAKNSLLRWLPSISSRLVVVSNGAKLAFTEPYTRRANGRPVIISVGRLHKAKNYGAALTILASMQNLEFEYWIAGEGPEEQGLKRLANKLAVASRVKFLGFVDDVPALLKHADIFFMPSLWEGFGLAAVEAMNASLPAVVSDIEGLGDLVSVRSGFKIPLGDQCLWREELSRLILSPSLRSEMGRNAFGESLSFSVEYMIDEYACCYDAVATTD